MTEEFRILLVDDDETILESLQLLLEDEGYVVETATTGTMAIAKTFEKVFNLAIVDWRLPDTEGTKLIGKFKETIPKMGKIMLTGYPSMQNAIDSVNNKADAFFQKPVSIKTLLSKIVELKNMQAEEKKYSEAKMTEFIETRFRQIMPKITIPQSS
jgi:DNA-binding NtrC family response regulator